MKLLEAWLRHWNILNIPGLTQQHLLGWGHTDSSPSERPPESRAECWLCSAAGCCGTQAWHSSGSTWRQLHGTTQRRAGSGGQKVTEGLAAMSVPLSQHTMAAQPSERSWKDAQSLARSLCPPREVLCPAHRGAQGSVGGGRSDPSPRPNPGLGMGCSPCSFPSVGAAGCGGTVGAVPAAAFADLVLETWDLHCDRNGREHRTADMGCTQLVLRRGQPFTITLRFSGRGYDEGVDKLSFNVQTGECPHICVAREGWVGVATLGPCPRAHLCSHGGCVTAPAPCRTVCSSPGRSSVHGFYITRKKKKKGRNSSP